MARLKALSCASAIALSGPAMAADLVIQNATLIDGTGADPRAGVSIVIENDRIIDIVEGAVDDPDALFLDAAGRSVMPGLGELHAHTSLEFLIDASIAGGTDDAGTSFEYPPVESMHQNEDDVRAFMAERFPGRMERFIAAGITTAVDVGSYFPWIIEMRDSVNSGALTGPRMFVTGPTFTHSLGHPASTVCHSLEFCVNHLIAVSDDPEVARQKVQMLAEAGVDGIKIIADRLPEPRISKRAIQVIIDEAHKHGLPVVAHSFDIGDSVELLEAGVDAFVHGLYVEWNGYQTSDGRDLAVLTNRHNVPVTTTYRFFEGLPGGAERVNASIRGLMDAGVSVNFGTDFEGMGLAPDPRENFQSEIRMLQQAGLSPMEIIVLATGNIGNHPMVPGDLGVIAPGKVADIIILKNDPLADPLNMNYPDVVIKGGEILLNNG